MTWRYVSTIFQAIFCAVDPLTSAKNIWWVAPTYGNLRDIYDCIILHSNSRDLVHAHRGCGLGRSWNLCARPLLQKAHGISTMGTGVLNMGRGRHDFSTNH